MRRFGTSSSRMKHWLGIRVVFLVIFVVVGVSAPSSPALSQTETLSPTERTQQAEALEKKKDYQGMVSMLEGHKDKIGRSGLILLARAFGKLNRTTDAITTLELANARYAKDAALQTLLGLALAAADRKDPSIEMLYKAKETDPKYVPAYDGLLAQLVKADSRQEARDLISDMSKRFGMKPRWASELCHLYVLDAFHEKAVEMCQRAMQLDPKNPKNSINLAKTYREQNEPDKAKNVLIKAAIRIHKSEPIQTALGDYFIEKKNYVDALKWYQAAAKNNPASFEAQLGLAQAALELQKMEISLAAFTAACKLKRSAIREFQSGLIKVRNRGDAIWQSRFENAISNTCQVSF